MKKLVLIIIIIVVILVVIIGSFFLIKFLRKKQQQTDVLSIPNWVNMVVFEEYLIKNFRIRHISVPSGGPIPLQVPILLIPKFATDYYQSIYYDIADLKENAIAIMYLTQIGNINLASRLVNSILYLMLNQGWDPFGNQIDPDKRIINYMGLARYYNVNIASSTGDVAIKQYYSDVASIYLSMALIKFILTYDTQLQKLATYNNIKYLIVAAAYDLWKFIINRQKCPDPDGPFFSFLSQKNLAVELTSSFHIALRADCDFIITLQQKYQFAFDAQFNPSQVITICDRFMVAAMPISNPPTDAITWIFPTCALLPDPSYANWQLSAAEDYLDLILMNYRPTIRATPQIMLDKILDSFYSPDTDASAVGCGPGIYNADCIDPLNPAQNCYNIACTPDLIPKNRLYFGIRASTDGKGVVFGMSALTLFAAALQIDDVNQETALQELNNIKNSLLKLYSEYGTSGILGGMQQELAFPVDPLNTGLHESMFRYPSLIATIYTAYAFLYLRYKDKNVNYMILNTSINDITLSTLGFDNADIYRGFLIK